MSSVNDAPRQEGEPGWPTRLSVQNWVHLILAGFVLVICGCVAVAGLTLSRMSDRTEELVDRVQPARSASYQLQMSLLDQETGVRGFALTGDESFLSPYEQGMKDEQARLDRVRALVGDDQGLAGDLDRIEQSAARWRTEQAGPLIEAARAEGPAGASSAPILRSKEAFDELRQLNGVLQKDLDIARDHARAELDAARTTRDRVLGALMVGALLVVIALSLLLHRVVGRPLNALAAASSRVRAGAFARRIDVTGPADVMAVAAAVENMRARLVEELDAATDREKLLAEQTTELRRSNSELEQFAYVASHDLQEPLRKVASFCQLLEKRYGTELDARGKQYIAFAVDGAKRMQVLINDLLTFSRVGRVHDSWKPVDLERSLDRALTNLSASLEDSGAVVVREGTLPELQGDATSLGMVWQNLIGNAIKFRRPDVPCRITVRCEQEDDQWHISVADNGIGIAPEFSDKVFVIFQRLHARDEYEGTGIGLSLCRKIVEFHGGRIWLDTAPEEGTVVHFTLPVVTDAPTRTTAELLDPVVLTS
ncbi:MULTISPECIES: sensor histidine kinase [unclassified Streptomyces]|uniref:sensor histidine kinase n=1 Tax=unclassified Streptomyces TaxID=2593676 RepID=UPI0001C18AAF|nr:MULTISPECIES: sensor histidine kinase [unclassified Streptomyces]RAJ48341.1 HAMP domain-containing protein [Streptomyces sp. DpondAA-A50]SCD41833.1 HAMP domain-containing protein [Streptomyces sp. DpondAA-F4a]AEN13956.1 multi-sensor signal transduction histidine kinase [Streptomyces sp. SirexAA-E]MYR67813.1 HAMP domain-containing protein [Streptomyces sp. SID4939]MYR99346.1 HAMP domain-containing protein [Streptomyces sp. SID4940]